MGFSIPAELPGEIPSADEIMEMESIELQAEIAWIDDLEGDTKRYAEGKALLQVTSSSP